MARYLYRFSIPPKVNPTAVTQIMRLYKSLDGQTTEHVTSHAWNIPALEIELETGHQWSLDVQEVDAGGLRSAWCNPLTGVVVDAPLPPPPSTLPTTPAAPMFVAREPVLS